MDQTPDVKCFPKSQPSPDLTLDGESISACFNGVESPLFDGLQHANTDAIYGTDVFERSEDEIRRFLVAARDSLDERIAETSIWLRDSLDHQAIDINEDWISRRAPQLVAVDLADSEQAHMVVFSSRCSELRSVTLIREVGAEFGQATALAALALGCVALSVRLAQARDYPYAWNAAAGAFLLTGYAHGIVQGESDASRQASRAAAKRHQPSRELKQRAIEIFKTREWSSKRAAAKAIFPMLQDLEQTTGFRFSPDRGPQTVYEWLLAIT